VKRGEVWWVEAPGAGRRPHLVVTRDAAIPVLHAVLGVPATRTIRGIPTEVEVGPEDGMPERCAFTFDNVRVLRKTAFRERICHLSPSAMGAVCRALGYATECAM
jgi:mRNA interferase MazF